MGHSTIRVIVGEVLYLIAPDCRTIHSSMNVWRHCIVCSAVYRIHLDVSPMTRVYSSFQLRLYIPTTVQISLSPLHHVH